MSDKKIKDYDLDNFENDIKFAPNLDKIEKDKLDYGDDFDTQTGEEIHNHNDYYIGKPTAKNVKKETVRKVKNGAVIACIAIVCLLVVFAFALTRCSIEDFKFSVTTPTTLPTIIQETQAEQEETDKPYEDVVDTEETTAEVEETTEEIVSEETQEATEPETVATEETTEAVETEPVTEEITELPDPEIEDFGQDQDY
jgi:hypothetical protein